MAKFYTADLHLDHFRIIGLCHRPFSTLEEMQNTLINNWNSVVSVNDDVYVLGDFCFSPAIFNEYIQKLNGVKHFLTGNHDARAIKAVITKKKNDTKKIYQNCIFHGNMLEVKDSGYKLVLCHYPIQEWNGFYKGTKMLHGHTHGSIGRSFKDNAFDVGVDLWKYTPVTLEQILNYKEV